jgi:hypothetical protein
MEESLPAFAFLTMDLTTSVDSVVQVTDAIVQMSAATQKFDIMSSTQNSRRNAKESVGSSRTCKIIGMGGCIIAIGLQLH